jgi:hypothetical protein
MRPLCMVLTNRKGNKPQVFESCTGVAVWCLRLMCVSAHAATSMCTKHRRFYEQKLSRSPVPCLGQNRPDCVCSTQNPRPSSSALQNQNEIVHASLPLGLEAGGSRPGMGSQPRGHDCRDTTVRALLRCGHRAAPQDGLPLAIRQLCPLSPRNEAVTIAIHGRE